MHIIGKKEIEAVQKVIESGKLFRYRPDNEGECDNFEKDLAKKFKTKNALMVTSGTNALVAGLMSLGVGPHDEVIIPSYTFVATATAVLNVGAIPIIANIDQTMTISPSEIEKKITEKTKAIIPVHIDGLACDMESICNIAQKNKLYVIEDTAQAIGGSYCGQHLGTIGEVGCYSLNQDKNITCGEGGIVVTNNRQLYEKMLCLQDASSLFNPVKKNEFTSIEPFMGMSMRVSEISGAIMRVQLERLDGILEGLRKRKKILIDIISNSKKITIPVGNCAAGDCCSSLHLKFQNPGETAHFGKKLREIGIEAIPPSMRPAHVAWKWIHLVNKKCLPAKFEFLQTMDIMMSTLRLEININKSTDETEKLGKQIVNLLK